MPEGTVVTTRGQLHRIAESFIAGPQYRTAGTIRLAVRPDGFTGTAVPIGVHGTTLEWPDGAAALAGPVSQLARASGLEFGPPPDDVYHSVALLDPDTVLDIDPASAQVIYTCLYAGGTALKAVLRDGHPVLWPEHFDVAVTDNEVNYGVSAGDDGHPLPYAYVGPWDFTATPRTGPFWNASFGARYPLDLSADTDTLTADIAEFFRRGQAQLWCGG